jgi:hypothetical protein
VVDFQKQGAFLLALGQHQLPFPEASHSTIKVFVKSGVVKTGALHITSLSCSKALVSSGVHENASFLVNVVKGASILP